MEQAMIPLLLYLLLQVVVLFVGMAVTKREAQITGWIRTYVFGQMMIFTILEVLAVPMILFHIPFNTLFWSFCGLVCLLCGIGILRFLRGRKKEKQYTIPGPETKERFTGFSLILLAAALLLIVYQACVYFFGVHLDEDDSRWLAQANDALAYGDMIWRNFSTGDYWGWIHMPKDAVSPWPMLYAVLARLLNTRTAIVAHTVFAPMELLTMYGIYTLLGTELFGKRESRTAFLLIVSVLVLFYGGTVYTQGAFSLVRIWQGKAAVAAVIVPLLLYLFVRINRYNRISDWIMILITDCAACLMSGMGISLAAFMIFGYGVFNILFYRNWKRIPLLVLSVFPSALLIPLYLNYNQVADFFLLR